MWYVVRYLRRRRRTAVRSSTTQPAVKAPRKVPREAWWSRITFASSPWRALWFTALPLIALVALVGGQAIHAAAWGGLIVLTILLLVIPVAVHHAEVIALKVGEPFGTLVLALAVTVVELALIASIMHSGAPGVATLARETVFATVMIVCNLGVGLCLFLGTLRHLVLAFRVEGTSPALAVLMSLATLTLVFPSLTTTTSGPTYADSQLIYVGAISLVLYGTFVFVQTVRHRDYFLPVDDENVERHSPPPGIPATATSAVLLLVALVAVVGLAKLIAADIRQITIDVFASEAMVGVSVALLVLLPETWAAVRAALRNRMQTSLNLLLGSALATIGLTIPGVAAISIATGVPLDLGLPPKETAMLALTFLVSVTTLAGGRATVLHGAVHLVLFFTYMLFTIVP